MTAAAGWTGPEFEMVVERGKVREFARAVHAGDPQYYEAEAPVAPPTFLASVLHWEPAAARQLWSELGVDIARMLQGEQEYVFPGAPPRAGARLLVTTRLESEETKEGRRGTMRVFRILTEFRATDGALVAEARNTTFEMPA